MLAKSVHPWHGAGSVADHVITLPVFLPWCRSYGFDPDLFGIRFIIIDGGRVYDPRPSALTSFNLKGVPRRDVTMRRQSMPLDALCDRHADRGLC